MEKKVLGIDFDDTLFDFAPAWSKYHFEQYGELCDVSWASETAIRRSQEFIHSSYHIKIPAIDGVVETTKILAQRRILVVVTARDEELREPTTRLLEKHFGDIFSDIHFMNRHRNNLFNDKGAMCKHFGVEEFIDDHVHHVEAARNAGVRSFLFTRPHNKQHEIPGVTRINSWGELLSLL